MRCRGLHRLANPAYLSGFPFSALRRVAPYCVLGGVRVVSNYVTNSTADVPTFTRDESHYRHPVQVTIKMVTMLAATS